MKLKRTLKSLAFAMMVPATVNHALAADAQSRSWSGSFFSSTKMVDQPTNPKATKVNAYNYLSLDYLLSDDSKLSARPAFTVDTQTNLADFAIVYGRRNSIYQAGVLGSTSASLFLPTSSESQKSGDVITLKPEIWLNYLFSAKWGVTYYAGPSLMIPTARESTGDRQVAGLEHSVELSSKIDNNLHLKSAAGFLESWRGPGTHDTSLKSKLGLSMNFFKTATGTFGAQNIVPLNGSRGDVKLFQVEGNSLFLTLSASL